MDLVVDDHPQVREAVAAASPGSKAALLAELPVEAHDWSAPPRPGRRIALRFHATPTAVVGDARVEALRIADAAGTGVAVGAAVGAESEIATGVVVRSIGYRGVAVPGLPFDEASGTIPHRDGRVIDPVTGLPLPGAYVMGWVKRGPSGGIGANRECAAETVGALLDDASARVLPVPDPAATGEAFARLVRRRRPEALGLREMRTVDRAERARGRALGRPRVKLATVPELLAAARTVSRPLPFRCLCPCPDCAARLRGRLTHCRNVYHGEAGMMGLLGYLA
ncbi:NADPH-dependent glutamate synthase beta subunit-like oxidoreductase [Streptacidiphilus sp. MAP12-20]|uniref:hypothetical protein n=1 Tax=Streptacidiphilus sp. MAP12-20 TaxID=3156299 RepID=UPI00351477CD